MKSILSLLFVFLYIPLLISCHQLNLENDGDDESPEGTYLQEISLDDGGEKRISLNYGEWNSLLVRVPVVSNSGYVKLSMARASAAADYLSASEIVVKIYNGEPFIGDSQYSLYSFDDDDNDTVEYYFISDGSEKYILLYHEEKDSENCIFDLSVESFDYTFEPAIGPDEYVERDLSPGETDEFSVPYWGKIDFKCCFQNTEIDKFYSLVVGYDRSDVVLPPEHYIYINLGCDDYDFNVEEYYEEDLNNMKVYIFKITSGSVTGLIDNVAVLSIKYCTTGDSLLIELSEITASEFTDDSFEPDQGPMSTTMDIVDSGSPTSDVHTIINGSEDWFAWQPWGDGNYKFSMELDNAWHVAGATEGLSYSTRLELIDRNGAEVLRNKYYYFYEPPVSPVISSDTLEFVLDSDTGDPFFFCIDSADDLSYRVLVEKL